MDKINDVFMYEKLTEIASVNENDQVVAKLKPERIKVWEEIVQINAEGAVKAQEYLRLERELNKLRKRLEAKKFLFWDEIEKANERFESAGQRGKLLAIKKDTDGSLVVVEFDAPQQSSIGGVFIMPPPEEEK